jgi:hypothetical protein
VECEQFSLDIDRGKRLYSTLDIHYSDLLIDKLHKRVTQANKIKFIRTYCFAKRQEDKEEAVDLGS